MVQEKEEAIVADCPYNSDNEEDEKKKKKEKKEKNITFQRKREVAAMW